MLCECECEEWMVVLVRWVGTGRYYSFYYIIVVCYLHLPLHSAWEEGHSTKNVVLPCHHHDQPSSSCSCSRIMIMIILVLLVVLLLLLVLPVLPALSYWDCLLPGAKRKSRPTKKNAFSSLVVNKNGTISITSFHSVLSSSMLLVLLALLVVAESWQEW